MGKKRKRTEQKSDADNEPLKKVPSVRSSDEPPNEKVCLIPGDLDKELIRLRILRAVVGDNIVIINLVPWILQ